MNFNIQTQFTEQDAINLFRDSGLNVERRNQDFEFMTPAGPASANLFVWVVQNPHTKKYMLLKEAFQKYLEIAGKSLVLNNVSKLDLYKIFEPCQDPTKK